MKKTDVIAIVLLIAVIITCTISGALDFFGAKQFALGAGQIIIAMITSLPTTVIASRFD